ncbi:MAG: hypothetical protein NT165_00420 [Candidatus Falkowbacteria bacterium]|nr:hypothetical protein [Candidatus Falkowbacteria bacterium]
MKKYFTNIIVSLLLAAIFPLTGAFCFQGLMSDCDGCQEEQVAIPIHIGSSSVQGQNALMPCCQVANHPEGILNTQSGELSKFVATISFQAVTPPETPKEIFIFHPLIIPPPKLLALKTTVLRL